MSENKHTQVETFDCQGCRPYCYGGYHMEADKDGLGDYVKAEDYRAIEKQRDELQEEVNALKERAEYDLAEFARTLDISYDEIKLLKKQRDELRAERDELIRERNDYWALELVNKSTKCALLENQIKELIAALENIAWARGLNERPSKMVENLERKALAAIASVKGGSE